MSVVAFTLSEEGVIALQNALACILKFSDDVAIEAKKDQVSLPYVQKSTDLILTVRTQLVFSGLNMSKSAYARFTFASNRFFSRYVFQGNVRYRERFFCIMYIRVRVSHVQKCWPKPDECRLYCQSSVAGWAAMPLEATEKRRLPSIDAMFRLKTVRAQRVGL